MDTINSLITTLDSNQYISTNEMLELIFILTNKYSTLTQFNQLINKLNELNYSKLNKDEICNFVNQLLELNPDDDKEKFKFKSETTGKYKYKFDELLELNPDDQLSVSSCCVYPNSSNGSYSWSEWIVTFGKIRPGEDIIPAVTTTIY